MCRVMTVLPLRPVMVPPVELPIIFVDRTSVLGALEGNEQLLLQV